MTIRKMIIEDYDKVYALWMSCVGMGLNNLDDSKEGIEKFLQRNPEKFDRNEVGNAFWEGQGFTVRNDLVYRNRSLRDIVRIDT